MVDLEQDSSMTLSIPDVPGALILKSPRTDAARMTGSDQSRIRAIATDLSQPSHASWRVVPPAFRRKGLAALEVLATHRAQRVPVMRRPGGPMPRQ
ncbi:hypothetical protein [Nocardia goodfellowii]|uniref:GNAT family N-acetyltransferase n=1 Tax=Nocardia goodfellowii TaxID=882446 RepID=A0ABS4Q9Y8_9NOCA|nr:hypothetical protein [Nocardia goodfellowii]MBP2188508.1 hypothetical protein [Nocardia goodfellowii]